VWLSRRARPGTTSKRATKIAGNDIERPVLPPSELFISPDDIDARLSQFASITLNALQGRYRAAGGQNVSNFPTSAPASCGFDARAEHPFAPFDLFLNEFAGRVLIAADSPGRREVLQEMLRGHGYNIVPYPVGMHLRRRCENSL